jgi:hypothetical protein
VDAGRSTEFMVTTNQTSVLKGLNLLKDDHFVAMLRNLWRISAVKCTFIVDKGTKYF